jgi:hypothetical protein
MSRKKVLLGGTAEGDGLCRVSFAKDLLGERLRGVLGKGKGYPEAGIDKARCSIQHLVG